MTAPAFLLNGISLLEYSTHWAEYPHYLEDISLKEDPTERMVATCKWFLSTLYSSYHERCKDGSEKKPFNPILGEQFFCSWKEPPTTCIVEQVSHHPPVSAFHIKSPSVTLTGHCGQKSKFKGMSIRVQQTGRVRLRVEKYNETIAISLPELVIRGLLSGNIFLELDGPVRIVSSLGPVCHIDFLPKPWFTGEYHCLKGSIFIKESDPEYKISGKWVDTVNIKKRSDDSLQVLFKVDSNDKPPEKIVKSLDEMNELESRKVWHKVAVALKDEEYGVASKEKNEIEEHQRELRKIRKEKKETWEPKFFQFVEDGVETGGGVSILRRSGSFDNIKTLDSGAYVFREVAK